MSASNTTGKSLVSSQQVIDAVDRKHKQWIKVTDDPSIKDQFKAELDKVLAKGATGPGLQTQIIEIFKKFFPVSWALEEKQRAEKLAQEEKTKEKVAKRKADKARRAKDRAEAEAKAEAKDEAKAEAGINPGDAPASEPTPMKE